MKMTSSSEVYIRVKLGIIEIDDVAQQYRPSVDVFFYFKAKDNVEHQSLSVGKIRFENIRKPSWVPHFKFENGVDKMVVTDESYWIDNDTGLIFGRKNMIPSLQQRFDHSAFPFDRHILDIRLHSSNCLLQRWENIDRHCPIEVQLNDEKWQIQGELNALADSWKLKNITMTISDNKDNLFSIANLCISIERRSEYYLLSIGFVLFLINLLQACIFLYPYNEARFSFAMQLVLTTVVFKFVIQSTVPKTCYMMNFDRYMVFGMLVLTMRFVVDTYLQATFELPVGDEGYRGKCYASTGRITVCDLDLWSTGILAAVWIVVSFFFFFLGPIFLRPSWKSMSSEKKKKRLRKKIIGKA